MCGCPNTRTATEKQPCGLHRCNESDPQYGVCVVVPVPPIVPQGVGKAMETEYHAGIGRTGEIYQQIRSEPIEDWLVKTYPTAPVWEALIAAEEAG